jgi:hypothetical protein
MKPITIHPMSALAGVASSILVFVALGAQSPVVESILHPAPRPSAQVQVVGIPAPEDMVLIKEEDGAFTVPPGKVFVLTGIGADQLTTGITDFLIDNVLILRGPSVVLWGSDFGFNPGPSIAPVPAGVVARSGASITVDDTLQLGRATGYLAPARP